MKIAVIPARGGSKRLPGKNVRLVNGRPMIAWSISAALESHVFERVFVSTDDPQIAAIAVNEGAKTIIRPGFLAGDHTPLAAVIESFAENNAIGSEWVCAIYATAPLLRAEVLRRAAERLSAIDHSLDFLVSVARHLAPAQRALRCVNGRVEMIWPENAMTRSQDLEPTFFDAAQFVFGRRSAWVGRRPLWGAATAGLIVDERTVADIDEEVDLERLRNLFLLKSQLENT